MTDRPQDRPENEPFEALDPRVETELAEALRAAYAPAPLSSERHRQIVANALEDPLAPPSADELAESARLRAALDSGDETHPDVALAAALKSASAPAPVDAAAVARARERLTGHATPGRVIYVAFGGLALAAAAAFALVMMRPQTASELAGAKPGAALEQAAGAPLMARSRTTDALFSERFEPGKTTSRVDRIALARAHELRENRYVAWGVR